MKWILHKKDSILSQRRLPNIPKSNNMANEEILKNVNDPDNNSLISFDILNTQEQSTLHKRTDGFSRYFKRISFNNLRHRCFGKKCWNETNWWYRTDMIFIIRWYRKAQNCGNFHQGAGATKVEAGSIYQRFSLSPSAHKIPHRKAVWSHGIFASRL